MNIHRAVGLLVDRPKLRVQLTATAGYTVEAPCLLAQLHDAFASSSGGHGGRTVPGSRMPLNSAALELWTEIAADAAVWAAMLGVDRARYRPAPQPAPAIQRDREPTWMRVLAGWIAPVAWNDLPEVPDPAAVEACPSKPADVPAEVLPPTFVHRRRRTSPPPLGLLLRAVAAAAAGREDRAAMADRITHNCRTWAGRIETMLAPDQAAHRSLSGVTCRACDATWVSDADDQPRLPALWVEYGETGVIRCLWCRACGAHTWRDELLQQAG